MKIKTWIKWIAFASILFILGNLLVASKKIKSVIIITIDTLRADHLSCYGYKKYTSPSLDEFFSHGTRFAWAFSTSSSTAPAHVSIFTGLYPSFHSVGVQNSHYSLSPEYVTLAEICLRHGFKTAAIISNPVLSKNLKLDQGFEIYDDELSKKELNRDIFEQTADQTVEKACRTIDKLKNDRFFLWLHFQDPHGPYTPPAEFASKFVENSNRDRVLPFGEDETAFMQIPHYQKVSNQNKVSEYVSRYDGEINFLDDCMQQLFTALKKADLLKTTLVVITADHGEAFGEDNFFFGHEHSVGMDQVHVPLAFIGPGIRKKKVIDEECVSNLDIFPTILDLLKLPIPKNIQSKSLKKNLVSGVDLEDRPIFMESHTQRGVIYKNSFYCHDRKDMEEGDSFGKNKGYRVFELFPITRKYFTVGRRDIVPRIKESAIKKLLHGFSTQADAMRKKIEKTKGIIHLSAEDRKKLESLGYL